MPAPYDKDACYCLAIAILTGVGASTARKIYEHGLLQSGGKLKSEMAKYEIDLKSKENDKEGRRMRIRQMRAEGLSLENIAEILGCDSSTVKRDLKGIHER